MQLADDGKNWTSTLLLTTMVVSIGAAGILTTDAEVAANAIRFPFKSDRFTKWGLILSCT